MGGKVVISYSGRGGAGQIITTPGPGPNPIRVFKTILNPAHPRLPCSYTRPNRGGSGRVTRETREFAIPRQERPHPNYYGICYENFIKLVAKVWALPAVIVGMITIYTYTLE